MGLQNIIDDEVDEVVIAIVPLELMVAVVLGIDAIDEDDADNNIIVGLAIDDIDALECLY